MPPKFDFSKVIAALNKSLLVSVVDVLPRTINAAE